MMLSQDTTERLSRASAHQVSYRPNQAIAKELHNKNLVMFVSPVAAGKSYLMNRIVEQDNDFSRVAVFTTREERLDDEPGMFRYHPHDGTSIGQLLDKIEAGEVVQYAIHPTSGRIYGSEITDYKTPFNMLATLSGVVDNLSHLPFATTHVIGLAVMPGVWLERLHARYPTTSDERTKRLKEAIVSLEWLLGNKNQTSITWVDNTSSDTTPAIQSIINAVKYNKYDSSAARTIAIDMLAQIKKEQL